MIDKLDDYIGKYVSKNCGSLKGILGRLTKNSNGYFIIYFDGTGLPVNEKTINLNN